MKKLTAMLAMLLSVSILLCACGSKADGGDTADDSNSGISSARYTSAP